MNPLLIGPVAELVKATINKIWPDPTAQAEANYKLALMVQSGELALMANDTSLALAQIAVNKAEAESESLFKGGWRPFIGWICGAGLGWNFIGLPVVVTAATLSGHPVALPPADMSELMPLLFALLGLGAYRTVEKLKGKQ